METIPRRKFLARSLAASAGAIFIQSRLAGKTINSPVPALSHGSPEDEKFWGFVKEQFPLEEGMTYFNNGSLGPSPLQVIHFTDRYRMMLDAFPSKYMWGGWNDEKEEMRTLTADFFQVGREEIALTHNTTEGMNLFARSFDLANGDEVILANHEHRTGVAPFEYYCEKRGVKLVRPELPLLPASPEEVAAIYEDHITSKTRLISIVHITNTNGMILPVREVSEVAHRNGIPVCVDGAQSAGMIKVNLRELGCDFYATSGHKWLFGPKGTGILYARKEMQHMLKPLLVSQDWKRKDIRMFEDYNTRNLPEMLGLGEAIRFNNQLGMEVKEKRIRLLKEYFRSMIEDDPRFNLKTPGNDNLSAGIQVVELVGKKVGDIQAQLAKRLGIDCRPMSSHGLNSLRISLSVFTLKSDVDMLVEGLRSMAK